MLNPGCREVVPPSLEGPCPLVGMVTWCSPRSGAGSVPGRAAREKGHGWNYNSTHCINNIISITASNVYIIKTPHCHGNGLVNGGVYSGYMQNYQMLLGQCFIYPEYIQRIVDQDVKQLGTFALVSNA